MFTVDKVIAEYYPTLAQRDVSVALLKPVLRRMLHEKAFARFAEQ